MQRQHDPSRRTEDTHRTLTIDRHSGGSRERGREGEHRRDDQRGGRDREREERFQDRGASRDERSLPHGEARRAREGERGRDREPRASEGQRRPKRERNEQEEEDISNYEWVTNYCVLYVTISHRLKPVGMVVVRSSLKVREREMKLVKAKMALIWILTTASLEN